jgi:hypothetical protein
MRQNFHFPPFYNTAVIQITLFLGFNDNQAYFSNTSKNYTNKCTYY